MCLQGERKQRHQCVSCKRRFSSTTFSLLHYLKKADLALNAKIFHLHVRGVSNVDIARTHYLSEHCVRGRLRRLSQRAFTFQAEMASKLPIKEELCVDGIENFAGSQFDPNNINIAVGKESLFVYSFNFCGLNRKGRKSPRQKLKNSKIEALSGRYNPKSIRISMGDLFKEIYKLKDPAKPLRIVSDQHYQYKRALKYDLPDLKIDHATVSSYDTRNYQNHLFAINHADLLVRQRSKAFARETIAFSKTPGAMCQKYALFMIRKNYMAPQFTKKHVRRPQAHKQSPAQALGLCSKILTFEDIFDRRCAPAERAKLSEDWKCFWHGEVPSKFQRSSEFCKQKNVA